MFIVINGQMVYIKHNRTIIIQRWTEVEKYQAARAFGISDVVAQAMVKGLCYTKTKGV